MITRTLLLPKSHGTEETWRTLVLKQKELRLATLKLSPQSFGSTYDREVEFDFETWDKRLQSPDAATFIAIHSTHAQPSETALLEESVTTDWRGSLVLAGPLKDSSTANVVPGAVASVEGEPQTTLYFRLNALYVDPEARGSGIGRQLILAAMKHAETTSKKAGARVVHFTLVVDYHNEMARALYGKCGFKITRRYFFDDFRPTKHEKDPQGQTEAAVMERTMVIDSCA